MIIGVTGSKGAGKSTLLTSLAAAFKGRGLSVGGIISARLCRNGQRCGYELLNLTEGSAQPLATLDPPPGEDMPRFLQLCHFYFYRNALLAGNEAIRLGLASDCLIIDEIGNWELSGGGWADHLHLLKNRANPTILGMRIGVAQDLYVRYGIELRQHIRVELHDRNTVFQNLMDDVTACLEKPQARNA